MVRLANMGDMPDILAVYDRARKFMSQNGNPTQWGDGYPQENILLDDIEKQRLYVYTEDRQIEAVFVFFTGDDPTYSYIEGKWLCDEPYGVIHRIASSGRVKGVFTACLDFCKSKTSHIRIDTHKDNKIMQSVLKKHGFLPCGTIYLESGAPRIAYELYKQA